MHIYREMSIYTYKLYRHIRYLQHMTISKWSYVNGDNSFHTLKNWVVCEKVVEHRHLSSKRKMFLHSKYYRDTDTGQQVKKVWVLWKSFEHTEFFCLIHRRKILKIFSIYLGVNLTKDVNDLYKENCKLLKKEIEKDYRRWKDLLCSWIGRINLVKNDYTTESNLHV
jgi:hypothetical protein